MSVYKRAWWFTGWTLFVFVTMPFWLFGFLAKFGTHGMDLGLVIWLLHGVAAWLLFKCGYCGASPYKTGPSYFPIYTPWPHRRCREGGTDLTIS
jgi:hypothetical protein